VTSNQAPERKVAPLQGLRHLKGDLDTPDRHKHAVSGFPNQGGQLGYPIETSSVSNGMATIISARGSVIISGSKWSSHERGSRTQASALLKYRLAILQPSIPKGSMALEDKTHNLRLYSFTPPHLFLGFSLFFPKRNFFFFALGRASLPWPTFGRRFRPGFHRGKGAPTFDS
jgi:hypothetical protein